MTIPSPLSGPRVARHRKFESELRELRDDELHDRLLGSEILDRGHAAVLMPGGDAHVFVKLVPLTALELESHHRHSTSNLFGLPTYYQYRLGGCGFGAWRELEIHRLANEWILSGQCTRFPLLHDWRILPIVAPLDADRMTMRHWGRDPAIARRVSAVAAATSSVVLFLEHFPLTLGEWFRDRRQRVADRFADALALEASVLEPLSFLHARGVLHMDAHFENVLTDGTQLFLGDFGLALSRSFSLGADEATFFENHQNFDRCTAISSHVHALVTRFDSNDDWRQTLREVIDGRHPRIADLPDSVRSHLARRGPVALAMGEFYRRLLADLTAEYPATSLQELLDDASEAPAVEI